MVYGLWLLHMVYGLWLLYIFHFYGFLFAFNGLQSMIYGLRFLVSGLGVWGHGSWDSWSWPTPCTVCGFRVWVLGSGV